MLPGWPPQPRHALADPMLPTVDTTWGGGGGGTVPEPLQSVSWGHLFRGGGGVLSLTVSALGACFLGVGWGGGTTVPGPGPVFGGGARLPWPLQSV